jgi:hypothetical protein
MRNMCLWGYYPIQDDPQNFNMYCLANSGSTELGNHNTGIPVLSTIIHNTGIKIVFQYCKYMISISILNKVDYINKSKSSSRYLVGIFNLNNCNYNIHINMNLKKSYCLILITISKYNN